MDERPDPDKILSQILRSEKSADGGRGKLKIFFGYAAGVGKTSAMLKEAHRAVEQGADVVVGYVEPHLRPETAALAEGLETIPNLMVRHRGIVLRELDLDALLARRPQIAVVDELAHTNAPGCRHRKRCQDVEELLRAGINVYTTVNVQHIEGLNDRVAAVTRVSVAERVPDRVFDDADAVELIDIEPAVLIERLRAGKVYAPERAEAALKNFFTEENLASLREISLRRMAERLTRRSDAETPERRRQLGGDVMVFVTADPGCAKAVRFAANLAKTGSGTLSAVIVKGSRPIRDAAGHERLLRANLDVAEEAGANLVTLYGDDAGKLLAQYADSSGVSHIVVAEHVQGKRRFPFGESLVNRLIRFTHTATVEVVPVAGAPVQRGPLRAEGLFRFSAPDLLKALGAIAIATCAGHWFYGSVHATAVIPMVFMLAVFVIARKTESITYALAAAAGSTLAYNYFFTVPRFTFEAYGVNAPYIFACIFAGTLLVSTLVVRTKREAESVARRAYRMEVLLENSRLLGAAGDPDACFETVARQIAKVADVPVVAYRLVAADLADPRVFDQQGADLADPAALVSAWERGVAAWCAANNERAGATTATLTASRCLYIPVADRGDVHGVLGLALGDGEGGVVATAQGFGSFEKNLVNLMAEECARVCSRLELSRETAALESRAEQEALRSNLLRAISHDLRTPLTSISGNAAVLMRREAVLDAASRNRMYADIRDEADWLVTMVENLLSITRIDNGSMRIDLQPDMVADAVREAMAHVDRHSHDRNVSLHVEDELLMAAMDGRLISQVVINLVNNAVAHTREGGSIAVEVYSDVAPDSATPAVWVSVEDDGPGIAAGERERIFDMFYNGAGPVASAGDARRGLGLGLSICRSIVEAHGGRLGVDPVEPHGSRFSFYLPAVDAASLVADMGPGGEVGR